MACLVRVRCAFRFDMRLCSSFVRCATPPSFTIHRMLQIAGLARQQSHPKIDWKTNNWLTEPTTDPTADPTETDPTADTTGPIEPTVRNASRLPVFERFPIVWFRKVCLCSEGFRKKFQKVSIGFHRFRKVSMKGLLIKVSKGFQKFSKSFRKVS